MGRCLARADVGGEGEEISLRIDSFFFFLLPPFWCLYCGGGVRGVFRCATRLLVFFIGGVCMLLREDEGS